MALAADEIGAAPERGGEGERERELTELGQAFRRMWRSLGSLRGRDTHLGGGELSHAQFELLLELREHGELSAGELASVARMAPGTVTQMLEHLALSGHVERSRSRSDRRVVLSRLTPQGLQRIEAKREAWKERWEQALADLESGQLQAATEVLQRLGAMFAERAASACAECPDQALENAPAARPAADSALL
jgi:MarR family transcriptional regulator, organic hydroperoxide resistance regulator